MSAKQILVIDDEQVIQEVLEACLEDLAGWKVMAATSGQQGLAIASQTRPDAILLDLSMPGMSGLETLEQLRANPVTQNIPVALLTATAQSEEGFLDLSIAGFIAKPFSPETLVQQVTDIFGW
jgi:two-component system, OmpR family, alkaline phosphatase synthesis response regulator PhoP